MTTRCFHGGDSFEAIGPRFAELDRRDHVINADVLDAWFPPAPSSLERLREHLDWVVRISPPVDANGLVDTIAAVRGVPREALVVGAGSSQLLFLALGRWLRPSSRVLVLEPTYGEYRHVCEHVVGCHVDRFPLAAGNDYELDLERLGGRLSSGYDLLILVNPDNPTGRHVRRPRLEAFLRRVPLRTRVWIDEAYVDYVGREESLESFAPQTGNVVVCRSLSKSLALSGVRVAYLSGPPDRMATLRALVPPWSVGLPGQIAAVSALEEVEDDYYEGRYAETHALRRALHEGLLTALPGARVVPGCANYLLCRLPEGAPDAAALAERCREQDLYLRTFPAESWEAADRSFRIAVKDARTQERMLGILQSAFREHDR